MKVKNDFPKVDRVLSALRQYVKYFEGQKQTTKNSAELKFCESALKQVDEFISAIEKYLDSVCNGEDRISRAKKELPDINSVQQFIADEDKQRTSNHSKIIMSMIMIDRISSIKGLSPVFDYAEEFKDNFNGLIPNTPQEKSKMTERERIKRRELGNFGLYIAASVTAGMHRDYMITDDEAREFASCESDDLKTDISTQRKVKDSMNGLKRNVTDILE